MSPSDDDSSDGALQGFFDELLGGGSANEEPQQDDSALEHQERVAEPENELIFDATADTGNDRDSWFTDDELKQGFTPSAEGWFRPDEVAPQESAPEEKPRKELSVNTAPETKAVSQSVKRARVYPEFAEPTHFDRAQARRLARDKLAKLLTSVPTTQDVVVAAEVDVKKQTPVIPKQELSQRALIKQELPKQELPKQELPKQETPVKAPAPVNTPPVVKTEVSESLATTTAAPAAVQIDDPYAWKGNGRPAWGQTAFDVLLFEVSGLTLAVPLIALGQIQPITDELTPLFGQADWFMGIQPINGGRVKTVNTAKFVMPERYREEFVKEARYVMTIDGLTWGLAVTRVNQPILLDPENVKWRTDRSKRPWLAGTVKEHMCALIDIPAMGKLLQESDRASGKR